MMGVDVSLSGTLSFAHTKAREKTKTGEYSVNDVCFPFQKTVSTGNLHLER
jgi:tRNA A37 threonylcarbamoyltransferase TsaD